MAIAYDAESNAAGSSTGNFNWTHTPSGTPKGVVVFVGQNTRPGTDEVSSVTYGGEPMARFALASDTSSESGRMYGYFLGTGLPTGPQSIVVTVSGNTAKTAAAVTMTASADTDIEDWGVAEEDQGDPTITLSTAAETYCAGGLHSGWGNVNSVAPGTDYVDIYEIDLGGQAHFYLRRTSNASAGSPVVDWIANSNDVAAVGVAVKESGEAPITGSLDVTLDDATLAGTGTVEVEGALAETLDAATLAATGTQLLEGALAETLDAATLAGTGTQLLEGALAETLDAATLVGTGTQLLEGALDVTLDPATLAGTGIVEVEGALDVTLDAATLVGTGVEITYTAFAELGRSAFYLEVEETATRTTIDASNTSLDQSNILNDPLWLGHLEGWRMEEGANLTRAGIHSRDLTDVNGSVGSAAGKHGAAACYLFGGVDELRASTPDFRVGGDFTVSWWIRPLDTWGPPNQPLLRYQDDATGIDWEVFSNNGKLYFRIHDSVSGSEEQFFENDWTIAEWHFCTLLYDATARRMRAVLDADLDNDRQTAALANGLRQSGTRLRLGDNAGAAADLLWQGDEMHLFNRLKDDAWVTDMNNGGAGRAYPT